MSSSSLTPDSGSDLSDLSDVDAAELEKKLFANKPKASLDAWLKGGDGASSPPTKRKREPSPPHDYVLADNPDIAFIVMFRARFATAFPKNVPSFGPQDLEQAVVGVGDLAEKMLCALLGLVCNRKKDIAMGQYNKALEEAISENRHQWPRSWQKNPMTGGTTFPTMTPDQRLDFLKALCLWALNASETIQATIKDSYKQNRHEDDLNQPLSIQPWGRDGEKRRYWLIEGQDDTYFRLYRESNPALKTSTWWSVASNIEEIKAFSAKLAAEGSQASRRLSDRINSAVPRFEAGEDKRKRREYRINRKMQFARPEPGFSLYEGRTRGKRQRYTFSDDEEGTSDAYSGRRSTRNATPAEPTGPVVTASGRQVRSRLGGTYGETLHSGQNGGTDSPGLDTDADVANARTRSGRNSAGRAKNSASYDSDEESDAVSSENEWQGNADEDDADDETDRDVDMDEDDDIDEGPKSLIVQLKVRTGKPAVTANQVNGTGGSSQQTGPGVSSQSDAASKSAHQPSSEGTIASPVISKPTVMPVGSPRPVFKASISQEMQPNGSQDLQRSSVPAAASTPAPFAAPSIASEATKGEPQDQNSLAAGSLPTFTAPAINGDAKPPQAPTPEVTMTS